jgi:hypothetical protein
LQTGKAGKFAREKMPGNTDQKLQKNLIIYLSIVGFFAIFSTTISKNPVLSLFSEALGANAAIIGLIAAVSPIAGIVIFYFGYTMGFFTPFALALVGSLFFIVAVQGK